MLLQLMQSDKIADIRLYDPQSDLETVWQQ